MESISLTLVNCFPFFCFKESESDKYIQYPSICFRFFKKELEKAERAANTVVV